jgi:hypothetical protein
VFRNYTWAIWKVRGLTLLLRVGTLWRCFDGLFFEVRMSGAVPPFPNTASWRGAELKHRDNFTFYLLPPLASNTLLTTLHPLLENVLQTVCRKLHEDSGTGGFLPRSSLFMVGNAHKSRRARSELYGGCSNMVPPISVSASVAILAACGVALS